MNNWLKYNQKLNFDALLNKLFRQSCVLCGAKANGKISLCLNCLEDLPRAPNPQCPQCGLGTNGETCGNCLNNAPHYDKTHALFSYTYPVDRIIQHYKYNNALFLSRTFGLLLKDGMIESDIDLIIPMPLHPNRMQARGFNQSLEMGKVIAKHRNLKLDTTSCSRIKNTPPQSSLKPKDRIKNMNGAFDCQGTMSGMHIVLIDDVMTTGASLNALAKTLKQAGATKVSCYVIARTI